MYACMHAGRQAPTQHTTYTLVLAVEEFEAQSKEKVSDMGAKLKARIDEKAKAAEDDDEVLHRAVLIASVCLQLHASTTISIWTIGCIANFRMMRRRRRRRRLPMPNPRTRQKSCEAHSGSALELAGRLCAGSCLGCLPASAC